MYTFQIGLMNRMPCSSKLLNNIVISLKAYEWPCTQGTGQTGSKHQYICPQNQVVDRNSELSR